MMRNNKLVKGGMVQEMPAFRTMLLAGSVLLGACGSIEIENRIPAPSRNDGQGILDSGNVEKISKELTFRLDRGILKRDLGSKDSRLSDLAALKPDSQARDMRIPDKGKADSAKADMLTKTDSKAVLDSKPLDSKPVDSAKPADSMSGPDALVIGSGAKCLSPLYTGLYVGYVNKSVPVVVGGYGFLYKGPVSHDGGPMSARYSINCAYQAVSPGVDCPLGKETVFVLPQDGRRITIMPKQIGIGSTIASIKVEKP
jgi:hypothetical protein